MKITEVLNDLSKAKKKFIGVEITLNGTTYTDEDPLTVVEEPISIADSTMSKGDTIKLQYEAEHSAWGYDVYVFETPDGREIGIKQSKFKSLLKNGYLEKDT